MTSNVDNSNDPQYQPQWDRYTKTLVTLVLLVAGVYALTLLAPVFQLLTIAFVVAFLMYGPARFITRWTPIPWAAAIGLLYMLLIIFTVLLVLLASPALVRAVNSLGSSAERAYFSLQREMLNYQYEDGVIEVLGTPLDLNPIVVPVRNFVLGARLTQGVDDAIVGMPPSEIVPIDLRQVLDGALNIAGSLTGTLTSAIGGVVGFLSTLLLAIFISALILIDLPNNRATLEKWIPRAYQREVRLLIQRIVYVWNGFFRGQVSIGILVGIVTYIQLKVMGITNAEILAVITGLISLIPTIGGIIALFPLGAVPLLQGSTVLTDISNLGVAVLVVLVSLIINQIIWNIIAPKILGDALELPLPFIIVGVFIGAALGGVLGAFLVAPAMGTIRILVVYALNKLAGRDPFPEPEPTPEPAKQPAPPQQVAAANAG
ncbi:AI-2E family transporter [Aggregatilineales bacterium SYSU G02658]